MLRVGTQVIDEDTKLQNRTEIAITYEIFERVIPSVPELKTLQHLSRCALYTWTQNTLIPFIPGLISVRICTGYTRAENTLVSYSVYIHPASVGPNTLYTRTQNTSASEPGLRILHLVILSIPKLKTLQHLLCSIPWLTENTSARYPVLPRMKLLRSVKVVQRGKIIERGCDVKVNIYGKSRFDQFATASSSTPP